TSFGPSPIGTFDSPNGVFNTWPAIWMNASGGSGSYTFSFTPGATQVPGMRVLQTPLVVAGGTQPAYLAGVIQMPGVYTIPIRVTDSTTGAHVDRTSTLTVYNTFFTNGSFTSNGSLPLPKATVNVPYTYTMNAIGGSGNYSLTATNLPAGLTVSPAGVISGTPTTVVNSNNNVTFTLTDTTNN